MQLIRCTVKLLKELGLKPKDLPEEQPTDSFLGQWHANLIFINRKKTLLFVNDRTLYNFIVPGVTRSQIRELPDQFSLMLSRVLIEQGFPDEMREHILAEYEKPALAKSLGRSVLGSANDFAFNYKYRIQLEGGIDNVQISRIIRNVNQMPMKAIAYLCPIEKLVQLYSKELGDSRNRTSSVGL